MRPAVTAVLLGWACAGGEKGSSPDEEPPSVVHLEWDDGTVAEGTCTSLRDVEVSAGPNCSPAVCMTHYGCNGVSVRGCFADRHVGTASRDAELAILFWSDSDPDAPEGQSTHQYEGTISVEAWQDQHWAFRLSDGRRCGYFNRTDDCVPIEGTLTIDGHIGAAENAQGRDWDDGWVDVGTDEPLCPPP